MQTMVAQLKEQAAQIQKVSAQLEANKPTPQVVADGAGQRSALRSQAGHLPL
jgi:hypothetical protein